MVSNVGSHVKEIVYGAYLSVSSKHFEEREQRNEIHPSYDEVKTEENGWKRAPDYQNKYHDNGIGKPELKYVNSDGREAVFDGDTHLPISDPDYIATYNYCPPYQLPEAPGLNDYYKLGTSYVGHFFCDMLPYYLFLDSNTREQFEAKIPLF